MSNYTTFPSCPNLVNLYHIRGYVAPSQLVRGQDKVRPVGPSPVVKSRKSPIRAGHRIGRPPEDDMMHGSKTHHHVGGLRGNLLVVSASTWTVGISTAWTTA